MSAPTLANMIGYGVAADRPAAGVPGRLYYSSDTDALERDNGTTWDAWTPGGGGGGGGGGITLIDRQVLGSTAASVTFSSIPNTYEDLRLVVWGRGDDAAVVIVVSLRFNGDTGSNYDGVKINPNAAALNNTEDIGDTSVRVGAVAAAGAATSTLAGHLIAEIPAYAATAFDKSVYAAGGWKFGTSTGQPRSEMDAGFWRSAAAITDLTVLAGAGNFVAGSRFSLYGLG